MVSLHQTKKRLPNRLLHHRSFRAAFLLFEDEKPFIKSRIPLLDLFLENVNLRMLAAEAQHRRTRDIWMMNVSRNQPTQVPRVFVGAAASALMQEESKSIHVFE